GGTSAAPGVRGRFGRRVREPGSPPAVRQAMMSAPEGLGSSSGIFRRKPIDQIQDTSESGGLNRTLGLWQLTAIGIGGIIGAGIFALAGSVAHGDDAAGIPGVGPAVLISFLIAGVASAAAAFSYAEFAGLIPKAGSAYTYGYAVL